MSAQTEKTDQEFAFPGLNAQFTGIDSDGLDRYETQPTGGMTLRDYFAAKAMAALIAVTPNGDLPHRDAAVDAYRYADAMLKERPS